MRAGFIPLLRAGLPVLLAVVAAAQVTPANSPAPVPYSSISELNLLLSQLDETAQAMQLNLAKLRIERWKTDANTKRSTQADVESLQRNLQSALPQIVAELRNSPENLSATFKLHRNLDALFDVFSSVVESTGAFGPRDDFQSLQNDLSALQRARRSFADRMENLADTKETELARLRTELQNEQAAAKAATPPKRVIVDDTELPAKPVKKKPAAKRTKPNPPSSSANSTGTAPQTPSPQP